MPKAKEMAVAIVVIVIIYARLAWRAELCIPGCVCVCWASPVALVVKNPPANAGDLKDVGSIPGSGRSPGVGNGNPL